jgi:quercetin dioxygenase-like cupin family protein
VWLGLRLVAHAARLTLIGENEMGIHARRSSSYVARLLLVGGLLSLGSVVCAQTNEKSSGVSETPVTSQPLPDNPERSLTAVIVELAPGATAARHHHAGIVFAYVIEGTVRSQLNNGKVIEYRTGEYWVEPPGTEHILTQNPSRTLPARLLAVFVAPTGAQLTTYDR